MVSTRRTASGLSAQAANPADDAATGAESRLTPAPTPAAEKKATTKGPQRKRAATRSKAAAVASAAAVSSSDDEGDEDDGLACLAQGMLDALCGMTGGGRKVDEGENSESESEDDAKDLPPPPPPTTTTSVAAAAAAADDDGASFSSSDSDSEGSDDEDEDAAAAPVNVSWTPNSLHLPRPASATPAIDLLARRARGAEEVARAKAAATAETSLALPRLSSRSSNSDNKDAMTSAAPPPRRTSWFDLPTQTLTPELKTDLRLLRLRGAMDPTRHYKSADTSKLPSRFHVGTVVESSTDFYSSRLSKSERGQTLTHELLKDRALSAQRKRRFGALQELAAARGKKGGGGKGAKVRKTSMPRLTKHRVRPKH